ncbi:hypothetical protein [Pseudomonas tremae]|uniref:hypothetical protein n=1 Tax=Pseudomonas tremae TaxID=200454 RepID=UPI0035324D7C
MENCKAVFTLTILLLSFCVGAACIGYPMHWLNIDFDAHKFVHIPLFIMASCAAYVTINKALLAIYTHTGLFEAYFEENN